MKAAVVRCFDAPPRYEDFEPQHNGPDDVVVDVLAAGFGPRRYPPAVASFSFPESSDPFRAATGCRQLG